MKVCSNNDTLKKTKKYKRKPLNINNMSNTSKVLVTIGIIIGFLFFFGLLTASRTSGGNSTPGIFGIILFVGMIAGIKAVWKKEKDNDDNHQLDKK